RGRKRCQLQGGARRLLELVDHALKHRNGLARNDVGKTRGGACAAVRIKRSRRRRGLPSPTWLRQIYLRQVAPIRKPRPIASPTVASGRCTITSSSVSSIECAASC